MSDMSGKNYYAKRTNWFPVNALGPNISHYIYLDANRNGIYDTADKPIVKIAVKMTRPDGSTVVRRSNLNGFVNFRHSLTQEKADVKEPGRYKFEVIVPDGWEITSNNQVQYVTYKKDLKSRSGFVVDQVPIPVGVVQKLYIKGKVIINDEMNLNKIELLAIKDDLKTEKKIDILADGSFFADVEAGVWKVKLSCLESNLIKERTIEVKNNPVHISNIKLQEDKPSKKQQQKIVDFEDITQLQIQKIPNGVAGVNWENLIVTNKLLYKGEGYINNTISGMYCGYNTSGTKVKISKDEGFDFYGGYFGVAWLNNGEGETIHFKAWKGDTIIDQTSYELSALGPFWFDADYRDITLLEVWTEHCWQFVTDRISVGTN